MKPKLEIITSKLNKYIFGNVGIRIISRRKLRIWEQKVLIQRLKMKRYKTDIRLFSEQKCYIFRRILKFQEELGTFLRKFVLKLFLIYFSGSTNLDF